MNKNLLFVTMAACSLGLAPVAQAETVQDIANANGIANVDYIQVGQVLHIEGQPDYTVLAGDTLTKISAVPANSVPSVLLPPAGVPIPPPVPAELAANVGVTPPQPLPAPVEVPQPRPVHQSVNWDAVAACESGGNWAIHTGNSYEGGLQFLNSTWNSVKPAGSPAHAYQASKDQQIEAAETLLHRSGIGQWPVCGRRA